MRKKNPIKKSGDGLVLFYNAVRPKEAGEFTWRLALQFLFPKKG